MSRFQILALASATLLVWPLLAEEGSPSKTKAAVKAAVKGDAPAGKVEAGAKADSNKVEPLNEKTIKERASYAIGVNFGYYLGQEIKEDNAEVDVELLVKGIKDALTKPKMDYTDQELSIAVEAFDKSLEAKNSATSKLLAEKNKKEGEAFLAKNSKQQGVHTTSSGLQYKILKSGDGKSPQKTDRVRVQYHGMLPDGSAFDSSKMRGDAVEFAVTSVIKGWTEALLQMKVGDKWVIYVPSDLAYGARRRSDVIGPNQVVVFEVELLDVITPKKVDVVTPKKTTSAP